MGKVSSVSLIDSQWVSTCRSRRELLHSALICQPFLASESVDQICSACTIIFIQHKLLKQSNILKTKHGSTNTLIMSTAISHCQQHLLLHSHCVVVWERCLVLFLDGRGAKHYRKECKVECCLKATGYWGWACLVLSIIDSGATCLGLQKSAIDPCRAAVSLCSHCLICTSA